MGTAPGLSKHIGLAHGVALYLSAILGAGVLVLPGQVASMAGPASLVAWGFACLLGVPLAWLFVSLARRFPDSGGVATYVREAFGPIAGGVAGWLYLIAGSVGQVIVPLTGGYYVAEALSLPTGGAYATAGLILVIALCTNLAGLRTSAHVQLGLAGTVAAALVVSVVSAVPRMDPDRLTPFAPDGIDAIGSAVIVLFFAFAGWEAVAHLVGEFRSPRRDVPRAVTVTIAIITTLYLATAGAVVLTGTYGTDDVDHIAIGLLLQGMFGSSSFMVAAIIAVTISLATTTAFIAGVGRLAYSLAGSGWLPRQVAHVTAASVPVGGILTVGAIALGGLGLAWAVGAGTQSIVVIPSTLVVAVYLLAALAGLRLLRGSDRVVAIVVLAMITVVVPAALAYVFIPITVAVMALTFRAVSHHGRTAHDTPRGADRR